jgi:hypothetical protein
VLLRVRFIVGAARSWNALRDASRRTSSADHPRHNSAAFEIGIEPARPKRRRGPRVFHIETWNEVFGGASKRKQIAGCSYPQALLALSTVQIAENEPDCGLKIYSVDNEDNPVSATDEKQTRMVAPSGNDIALQRTESWYMSAAVLENGHAGRNCWNGTSRRSRSFTKR